MLACFSILGIKLVECHLIIGQFITKLNHYIESLTETTALNLLYNRINRHLFTPCLRHF